MLRLCVDARCGSGIFPRTDLCGLTRWGTLRCHALQPVSTWLPQLTTIEDARARPAGYVLKPQREGGGNNLYHDGAQLPRAPGLCARGNCAAAAGIPEISSALASFDRETLAAYVLMARIDTPAVPSVHVRHGAAEVVDSVSELGIYSVFISDGRGAPALNEYAGYLLRTKARVDAWWRGRAA